MKTSDDRDHEFYRLYEQLASATSNINQAPDVKLIKNILNQLAAMFRLSKGITHFYANPSEELNGTGETIISYDTGKEGKPVHTVRFVTKLMSITTMTVYMTDDEVPLTDDEFAKVDLSMRTALAYISRNRMQDIAENLAFYDDAGFRNIRSLYNYIEWRSKPGALHNKAAIYYNLRHFSLINEELGRNCGDIVMKNHYNRLREMIGSSGILTRLGGDNFIGICNIDDLPEILEYLTEAKVSFDDGSMTTTIRASVGIFVIPDGFIPNGYTEIMVILTSTGRLAQNGTQGHIIYYEESLIENKEKAKRLQQRFPDALENKEFQVYYQPKVNTATGEICGAEALCRWFRNGKMIPPMDFIPILEETTDICKLDFYMLDLVCSHIRKWIDEGRTVVRVSVNLSRKHMMDFKLLETIIGIIDKYKVPHNYIEIELTETTTDIEFHDLRRVVSGLQTENICTSVDDFGMGYSSLNMLRVIPWNVLKVDRSFLPLDDEEKSSIRSIMFRHVVAMARELGIECIVEGVETPVQLEILRENNCELAQGYLFDRPLPVEEFEKRLDMKKYHIKE